MNLIKKKREELRLSQADLGKALGVSQQHINRFENNYPIPLKHIPKLATLLGIDIKTLLPDEFKFVDFTKGSSADNVTINMLDITACCGDGIENIDENIVGQWQMPTKDFKAITFTNPENVKMIRVSGDSMEATLSDGDYVLVDISRNFLDSDGLFLIKMSSGLAVKRIQNTITDKIIIKSDNPKYENLTTPINEIRIVGKVIYTLKAEKVG